MEINHESVISTNILYFTSHIVSSGWYTKHSEQVKCDANIKWIYVMLWVRARFSSRFLPVKGKIFLLRNREVLAHVNVGALNEII